MILIRDAITELRPELGIGDRHGEIDGAGMTDIVRGVMRERAQRKRELLRVPRLAH